MHRRMVPRALGTREAGSFWRATPVGKATSYRAGEENEERQGCSWFQNRNSSINRNTMAIRNFPLSTAWS